MKRKTKNNVKLGLKILLILFILLGTYYKDEVSNLLLKFVPVKSYALSDIPEYSDKGYVVINNNEPYFTEEDKERKKHK